MTVTCPNNVRFVALLSDCFELLNDSLRQLIIITQKKKIGIV